MIAKILWLFVILVTLCVVIEASVLNELKIRQDYEKLKIRRRVNRETEDIKEPETTTEQTPKLHRVTLTRTQPVRFQHYQTEDENTKQRNVRDVNEYKTTKNNQKQLKLNRTNYKNRKTKDRLYESSNGKYAEKEKSRSWGHIDGTKYRIKRNAISENLTNEKADYYAQRKAVMDRFHARQKEIAEKYAKKTATTTPRYINDSGMTTESPTVRNETNNVDEQKITINNIDNNATVNILKFIEHGVDTKKNKHNAPWFNTKETNSLNIGKKKKDYYDSNAYGQKSIKKAKPTLKTNNDVRLKQLGSAEHENMYERNIITRGSSNSVSPNDNKNLLNVYSKSGKCGKLVYQHNFIIGVHNSSQADADILTSIEGSFCITCVEIERRKKTKATIELNATRREDGTFSEMKLHIKGFENEEILIVVKVFAVEKVDDRCDHYY
ncbi:uncharacterized protein LOC108622058 [Ceratina calcarata]|uniref:Uncharacterized protein LOC108622058 n=1 Tax=Ceratina calcarata TaxID=156304 RepID=A0AAJ7IRC4_9HYME|nr:uncharacterized protein LOC108622058 [Ceratina calcarata]